MPDELQKQLADLAVEIGRAQAKLIEAFALLGIRIGRAFMASGATLDYYDEHKAEGGKREMRQ